MTWFLFFLLKHVVFRHPLASNEQKQLKNILIIDTNEHNNGSSLQELKQRLRETKQRGVVLREGESIEELYAEREELYRHFADVTVSEEGLTLEKTVCAVMEMVP